MERTSLYLDGVRSLVIVEASAAHEPVHLPLRVISMDKLVSTHLNAPPPVPCSLARSSSYGCPEPLTPFLSLSLSLAHSRRTCAATVAANPS